MRAKRGVLDLVNSYVVVNDGRRTYGGGDGLGRAMRGHARHSFKWNAEARVAARVRMHACAHTILGAVPLGVDRVDAKGDEQALKLADQAQ